MKIKICLGLMITAMTMLLIALMHFTPTTMVLFLSIGLPLAVLALVFYAKIVFDHLRSKGIL